MAISAAYENSATISTTEYSLPGNTTTGVPISHTTDGVYQIFIDLNALAAGDQYELKIYEKVTSGGTQRLVATYNFVGAQGNPIWVSPSLIFLHGWDVTLDKIAGTDRSIAWSIRQVA